MVAFSLRKVWGGEEFRIAFCIVGSLFSKGKGNDMAVLRISPLLGEDGEDFLLISFTIALKCLAYSK